jgi:hypothetical protein
LYVGGDAPTIKLSHKRERKPVMAAFAVGLVIGCILFFVPIQVGIVIVFFIRTFL